MFKVKKIIVVMPAYNVAKTLQKTYDEVMEQGLVDWLFWWMTRAVIKPLPSPGCSIPSCLFMNGIGVTAAIRRLH